MAHAVKLASPGQGWQRLFVEHLAGATHEPPDAHAVFSKQLTGRLAALLYFLSGLSIIVVLLFPTPATTNHTGVLVVGTVAMLAGIGYWFVPWSRLPRSLQLWLVPCAFVLIGLHNYFNVDPFHYGLFYVVTYLWVGLSQRPGASVRLLPPLIISYLVPLIAAGQGTTAQLSSVIYTVTVCLLVGETLSLGAAWLGRTQWALREAERRYRTFFEDAPLMYVGCTLRDGIAVVSDCDRLFLSTLGYNLDEVVDRPITDFYTHPSREASRGPNGLERLVAGAVVEAERQLVTRDGRVLEALMHAVPQYDAAGRVSGLRTMFVDVTERKHAEELLRESELRLAQAQQVAQLGSWEWDAAERHFYWSDEFYRILGYEPRSVPASLMAFLERVHPEDRAFVQSVFSADSHGVALLDFEHRIVRPDGSVRTVHAHGQIDVDDQGRARRMVGTGQDITERKVLEQRLSYQASHDALTGLPNRVLFLDRVEHALGRWQQRQGALALLMLDLDNFKVVNDSLGHPLGDLLLVTVTERLRGCVLAGDTVARFGGDEFTLLLEDRDSAAEVMTLVDRLTAVLRVPVMLEGHEFPVTASIGVVFGSRDVATAEEMLRLADIALYEAKRHGKARAAVFNPKMRSQALERLQLEEELRRGIERAEFEVYYQPVVDLHSGRLHGVEALVRWNHPARGQLLPGDFIAVAEESGLIVPLGQWVLEQACGQVVSWQRADEPELGLSVNLSARQFRHSSLVDDIAGVLEQTGLPAARLTLEITESLLMENLETTTEMLLALRELGIRLAIDDFGVGYSSLSYLKNLPVDTVKIDRSFVRGIGMNAEDEALIQAIVAAAQALRLSVTAEGIESAAQVSQLERLGCDRGQGFLFGRPSPLDALPLPILDRIG